ncbi:hypothetical protein [Streptomyces sp. NPDC048411]
MRRGDTCSTRDGAVLDLGEDLPEHLLETTGKQLRKLMSRVDEEA